MHDFLVHHTVIGGIVLGWGLVLGLIFEARDLGRDGVSGEAGKPGESGWRMATLIGDYGGVALFAGVGALVLFVVVFVWWLVGRPSRQGPVSRPAGAVLAIGLSRWGEDGDRAVGRVLAACDGVVVTRLTPIPVAWGRGSLGLSEAYDRARAWLGGAGGGLDAGVLGVVARAGDGHGDASVLRVVCVGRPGVAGRRVGAVVAASGLEVFSFGLDAQGNLGAVEALAAGVVCVAAARTQNDGPDGFNGAGDADVLGPLRQLMDQLEAALAGSAGGVASGLAGEMSGVARSRVRGAQAFGALRLFELTGDETFLDVAWRSAQAGASDGLAAGAPGEWASVQAVMGYVALARALHGRRGAYGDAALALGRALRADGVLRTWHGEAMVGAWLAHAAAHAGSGGQAGGVVAAGSSDRSSVGSFVCDEVVEVARQAGDALARRGFHESAAWARLAMADALAVHARGVPGVRQLEAAIAAYSASLGDGDDAPDLAAEERRTVQLNLADAQLALGTRQRDGAALPAAEAGFHAVVSAFGELGSQSLSEPSTETLSDPLSGADGEGGTSSADRALGDLTRAQMGLGAVWAVMAERGTDGDAAGRAASVLRQAIVGAERLGRPRLRAIAEQTLARVERLLAERSAARRRPSSGSGSGSGSVSGAGSVGDEHE